MRSEKLARVRHAASHAWKKLGYCSTCKGKSLRPSEQGGDTIQFTSAGWRMCDHGDVRWAREEAAVPKRRPL